MLAAWPTSDKTTPMALSLPCGELTHRHLSQFLARACAPIDEGDGEGKSVRRVLVENARRRLEEILERTGGKDEGASQLLDLFGKSSGVLGLEGSFHNC